MILMFSFWLKFFRIFVTLIYPYLGLLGISEVS